MRSNKTRQRHLEAARARPSERRLNRTEQDRFVRRLLQLAEAIAKSFGADPGDLVTQAYRNLVKAQGTTPENQARYDEVRALFDGQLARAPNVTDGFLRRILQNLAIDAHRATKREERRRSNLKNLTAPVTQPDPSAESWAAQAAAAEERGALRTLRSFVRAAVGSERREKHLEVAEQFVESGSRSLIRRIRIENALRRYRLLPPGRQMDRSRDVRVWRACRLDEKKRDLVSFEERRSKRAIIRDLRRVDEYVEAHLLTPIEDA